jgi:hypothetical protein
VKTVKCIFKSEVKDDLEAGGVKEIIYATQLSYLISTCLAERLSASGGNQAETPGSRRQPGPLKFPLVEGHTFWTTRELEPMPRCETVGSREQVI